MSRRAKPSKQVICKNDEEIIETMLTQLQNYYPVVPDPKA